MPGILNHSPADIIRYLLIQMGAGVNPTVSTSNWPIYVSSEPNLPDNCITIFDTLGEISNKNHLNGKVIEHNGFQIRVRAENHPTGYVKANSIAQLIDTELYRESVTIDSSDYCIHSVKRVSDIIPLGTDSPTSKRYLFTINFLVYLYLSL